MGNVVEKLGALLIYGGSFALRSYERQCIESWIESLSPRAKDIMTLQFSRLDRYKRLNRDKLLQLFPTGWPNGVPLPAEIRVPLREDESRVARIKMILRGVTSVECDVVVVMQNGQLKSLEFSKQPPPAAGAGTQIQSIQHLRDVCATAGEEASERPPAHLPGGFQWLADQPVRELKGPRSEKEVREFLVSFGVRLPDEYGELLTMNNGFSIGRVTVYGVGDAWMAPRRDGPFVVLGNVMDVGDIACKVGDQGGQIYLLDMESDQVTQLPSPLSQSLRELSLKSERLDSIAG